jgi:hypothetical protein
LCRGGMDTLLGKRGGEGVPQGMERETLILERGFRKERSKLSAVQVGRVHGLAHGVGEHEVVIFPSLANP